MRDTRKTVKDKLAIAIEAINCKNTKKTAKKYVCSPSQVRKWIKTMDELRVAVSRNPRARTLNTGPRVIKKAVEDEVYDWIIDLRQKDLPVTTLLIISKALAVDSAFHGGSIPALWSWIYPFLHRRSLSIRRVTHEGQKLSGHLASVQRDFVACVMERFGCDGTLSRVTPSGFVNMDETAVFFETKTNQTVNPIGDRTIAIRCSNSNAKRMTICVACASDGTKLPLMFVLKGKPDGRIERSLCDELPEGTFGCCGDKGWMDERSCRLWFEKIWLPQVSTKEESLLLLDEFKCHMQKVFVNKLADAGSEVEFIPGGYTSVLQPCDVGINRPFKKHIREQYTRWAVENLKDVERSANVPVPSRKDVCLWAKQAWDAISPDSIRRTFARIGYCNDNRLVLDVAEEDSESCQEIVEDDDVLIF